jgi:hypothetical protein
MGGGLLSQEEIQAVLGLSGADAPVERSVSFVTPSGSVSRPGRSGAATWNPKIREVNDAAAAPGLFAAQGAPLDGMTDGTVSPRRRRFADPHAAAPGAEAGDGENARTRRYVSEPKPVMASFVQFLESSLHSLVPPPVAVAVMRWPASQSVFGGCSMSAAFRVVQPGAFGIVSVDAAFIDALVCSAFGTERRDETRGYSAIERALVKRAIAITLADLARALRPRMNVDFAPGPVEIGSIAAGERSLEMSAAVLRITLGERTGGLKLMLPMALGTSSFDRDESHWCGMAEERPSDDRL